MQIPHKKFQPICYMKYEKNNVLQEKIRTSRQYKHSDLFKIKGYSTSKRGNKIGFGEFFCRGQGGLAGLAGLY